MTTTRQTRENWYISTLLTLPLTRLYRGKDHLATNIFNKIASNKWHYHVANAILYVFIFCNNFIRKYSFHIVFLHIPTISHLSFIPVNGLSLLLYACFVLQQPSISHSVLLKSPNTINFPNGEILSGGVWKHDYLYFTFFWI